MPIYEYKCDNCGDVFEKIEKFSDPPHTVHEKCGGPVHRLISLSALKFKGSGWYINDYAKAGAKPDSSTNGAEKSDSGAESKSDAKSESKADTKSESKSDATSATKTESKTKSSKSDTPPATKTTE